MSQHFKIKLYLTTEFFSKQNLIKNFDSKLIREKIQILAIEWNTKLNFYLSRFAGLREALRQSLQLLRYIEKLKGNNWL